MLSSALWQAHVEMDATTNLPEESKQPELSHVEFSCNKSLLFNVNGRASVSVLDCGFRQLPWKDTQAKLKLLDTSKKRHKSTTAAPPQGPVPQAMARPVATKKRSAWRVGRLRSARRLGLWRTCRVKLGLQWRNIAPAWSEQFWRLHRTICANQQNKSTTERRFLTIWSRFTSLTALVKSDTPSSLPSASEREHIQHSFGSASYFVT